MTTIFRFALPAMLALGAQFPGAALAQASPHPAPMNPAAAAQPLAYESAFTDYKPGQEPVLIGWKESNARVAEPLAGAGGHDAHAGHDMGGMGHGAKNKAVDEHAGHDMGAGKPAADAHAGHDMGAGKPAADPHAGHDMGAGKPAADPHAGHDMGGKKAVADAHAGHDMAKDHGGHKKPAPPAKKDPHHGHQHKE